MAEYQVILDELSRLRKIEAEYNRYRSGVGNIIAKQINEVHKNSLVVENQCVESVLTNLREVLRKVLAI